MQQTTPEAATASDGETAFILQLRPAFPPDADPDALSGQIDQFLKLYLGAAGPHEARCARLQPLTWAISAAPDMAASVEQVRADLAETLFGCDDGENVRLLRQDHKGDAAPQADAAKDDAEAGLETGAWEEPGPAPDPDLEPPPPPDDPSDDPFAGWEPAHSSAATRAAMDDASNVLDLDAPDLSIIDGDVFDVDAWNIDASIPDDVSAPFDEDDGYGAEPDQPGGAASGPGDVAAELAAFRAEMREIAAGIPAVSDSDALEQFRTELDTITGSLGQRVDGAAQRIETAAERVTDTVASLPDADRMAGAVERAEASAKLMESSVREAVEALTATLKAMNAAGRDGESQADIGT